MYDVLVKYNKSKNENLSAWPKKGAAGPKNGRTFFPNRSGLSSRGYGPRIYSIPKQKREKYDVYISIALFYIKSKRSVIHNR